ncbi:MAG: hypothetical protein ABW185_05635 [Sedimenticola sp.]
MEKQEHCSCVREVADITIFRGASDWASAEDDQLGCCAGELSTCVGTNAGEHDDCACVGDTVEGTIFCKLQEMDIAEKDSRFDSVDKYEHCTRVREAVESTRCSGLLDSASGEQKGKHSCLTGMEDGICSCLAGVRFTRCCLSCVDECAIVRHVVG